MSLSIDQALRRARRHAEKGEADLAAQKYKRVLEKDPENKQAIEGLTKLQQRKAATKDGSTQQRVAELIELYGQGKHHEALIQGETLARQFPDMAFIQNLLGAVNVGLGRPDQAVVSYRKALQIKPDYAEAHNNLGNSLYGLGETEEAVLSLTRALQIRPDFAEANNNLGTAQYDLGKLEEAVASHRKALQIEPGYAEAHNNLGNALIALGRPKEAVASYDKALQTKPDFAEAHSNLGNALIILGKPEEALLCLARALRLKPDYAEAHSNLGTALCDLGKLEEAVASYHLAVQLKPDFAEAHSNLGNTLTALEKPEEAILSLATALRLKPDYADAHNNLGNVLYHLGRVEEAAASYDIAVQLKPDFAEAHSNLGNALKSLGKPEEAVSNFGKALQLKPDYAEAHRNLSAVKIYQDGDPQTQHMLQLLEDRNLSDTDRMHLYFALGKAYADIGDHDQAFTCLVDGNRLRKEELKYEISSARTLSVKIKSMFSGHVPALDVVHESEGGKSQRPVFILGMPRSGTTLVEQILGSHSQVHGAGELRLLNQVITDIDWKLTQPSSDQLQLVRRSYLSGLTKIGASAPYITDKMPANFWWIGFIFAATPEAKVVHVKRDARATCWSIFKHYFAAKGNGFACDLQDVAEYYKLYIDLMAFWHEEYPRQIYDLNYEALTEQQNEETRKLLQHIGLNWEDQCLEFQENKRAVQTASATQVRQKMYQGSSDEWRKYEKHLEPMVKLLKDSDLSRV